MTMKLKLGLLVLVGLGLIIVVSVIAPNRITEKNYGQATASKIIGNRLEEKAGGTLELSRNGKSESTSDQTKWQLRLATISNVWGSQDLHTLHPGLQYAFGLTNEEMSRLNLALMDAWEKVKNTQRSKRITMRDESGNTWYRIPDFAELELKSGLTAAIIDIIGTTKGTALLGRMSDIDRRYLAFGEETIDVYLSANEERWNLEIITNPDKPEAKTKRIVLEKECCAEAFDELWGHIFREDDTE